MDFSWSEEELALRTAFQEFAEAELVSDVVERDWNGSFSKELWQKAANFGVQALAAPAKCGGRFEEIDLLKSMLAMEGLGYGCRDNGLAFALNAQMWTVQLPICHFGNEDQQKRYVTKMVTGERIGAHALTEPEAGSDIYSIQLEAQKTEGGYLLNGTKKFITLGPVADFVLVLATINPKLGKWGVTAFLVDKNTQGMTTSEPKPKMGMRTVPFGEIRFENCFVPTSNRLGKEGVGFSIINYSLEYDRCCILASQLGRMEKQLEEVVQYVKERKQFGQPIGSFQSVSNRLADMKLRLETSRLLLYKVAWLKQNGQSAIMESALLKLQLSESFVNSSIDAIRSYGGNGYLTSFEAERDLRDAMGGLLYAGTSDIQRNIIAKMLGL